MIGADTAVDGGDGGSEPEGHGGGGGGGSPHKGKHWLKLEGISCRWFTNTKYSFYILIPYCI